MPDANQKAKKPIYKKWWFWLIVIFVLGIIGSVGGQPPADQTEPPTSQNTEPTNAAVSVTLDPAVAKERQIYDTNRGNNAEAADLSSGLITNAKTTGIGEISVYLKLDAPEAAETQFTNGGPLADYQQAVTDAAMTVVMHTDIWSQMNEDNKRDFVSTFLTVLHGRYTNTKYPVIQVSNGIRVVATGSWSYTQNGPTVELK